MKISGGFCSLIFNHLCLLLLVIAAHHVGANVEEEKKFYIIYLGDHLADQDAAARMHVDVLTTLKGDDKEARNSLVHSYTKSFNAFAALLSQDEASRMSNMDAVLSVFPSGYSQLHTTKSWDFLGLPQTARRKLKIERDIIVGLLDSGINMESESFKDNGIGPPPSKWKGTCDHHANFSGCNNKVIGARYFKLDEFEDPSDILSPADTQGHGSHTSSTLAGNLVTNASLYGLANGTARGAVPSARIAMYKVCWVNTGCSDMDILAAFDAAIHDGVDLISISIGGAGADYSTDPIAIGSFHAMKKGILTVASAGNYGPGARSVSNHAPWIFTVAASGIDRDFRSNVSLGNGLTVEGVGISAFEPTKKTYPLIHGADGAKNKDTKDSARFCMDDSLDPSKVNGKLVFCEMSNGRADSIVKLAGGAGTIVESQEFVDAAQIFMTPGTMVNYTTAEVIYNYIHSTKSPSAVIYKSKEVKIPAPFVASFSSRGPNPGSQNLLKPDIAAPGIDILAAYTPLKSITGQDGDTQFSKYNLMSGTSMACPHVAGVAAYVKSFHPDWSPSMIKSAIITTATPMSKKVNKEAEFAYGSGQLNPSRAKNPGLVYEADQLSYIQFLCHEGYNGSSLATLVGSKSVNCSQLLPGFGQDALNYPTIQLSLINNNQTTTGVFKRLATNVGPAPTVFNSTIRAPPGVTIMVHPKTLTFTKTRQKKSFTVVVKAKADPMATGQMASGSLVWRSSRYIVRSPIVVYSPESFHL
uniref:Subtilisin-like protease SBT4.14 n=2 Tax=Kalanchoe fedtschenkoi TaxID=63787 RepID=A0A7N0T4K2_KALFE